MASSICKTGAVWFLGCVPLLCAHPMGNFSVNHYARFDLRPQGIELTYALDLAEIPTFELLSLWNVDARDRSELTKRATMEARVWLSRLHLRAGGKPVRPELQGVSAQLQDGAAGLPVLRVTITATLAAEAGEIEYEERNYLSPPGWKEIVVAPHTGVRLAASKNLSVDRSRGLTAYPDDATASPPQETKTRFRWLKDAGPAGTDPLAANPGTPPAQRPRSETPGTVVRGDYLSRMLGGRSITFGIAFAGLCVAFGLGAMHALSPGHGKTVVAAYLVGSQGTTKHALLLGATLTFTHTSTVFALGLGVLFFKRYVVPEKVIPVLGAVSGLSIVALGALLLYRRVKALQHERHHKHSHPHTHSHGEHGHSHLPAEGAVTLPGLIALGMSGGLVPCPSALVLLLSAIALGRTGLGLILLIAFSAGLALVLVAIGVLVLHAKNVLTERNFLTTPILRYMPVCSAAVVLLIGLVMTGVSLG